MVESKCAINNNITKYLTLDATVFDPQNQSFQMVLSGLERTAPRFSKLVIR
jgi:hypothetical protein